MRPPIRRGPVVLLDLFIDVHWCPFWSTIHRTLFIKLNLAVSYPIHFLEMNFQGNPHLSFTYQFSLHYKPGADVCNWWCGLQEVCLQCGAMCGWLVKTVHTSCTARLVKSLHCGTIMVERHWCSILHSCYIYIFTWYLCCVWNLDCMEIGEMCCQSSMTIFIHRNIMCEHCVRMEERHGHM